MTLRIDGTCPCISLLESHFGSACFIDSLFDQFNSSSMWIVPDITREEEILKIRKRRGIVISIDKEDKLTPCVELLINNIDFSNNKTIVESIMCNVKFWIAIDANYLL